MDIEFNSLEELYNRLKPALNTKQREMIRNGYNYIKIEDIWNYLKDQVWSQQKNLELYHIVHDIMNCDEDRMDDYFKKILESKRRKPNLKNI